jgi:hypothetical protein
VERHHPAARQSERVKYDAELSGLTMVSICLPPAPLPCGAVSKVRLNARRNSFGSRWTSSRLSVMMRISLSENVLQ